MGQLKRSLIRNKANRKYFAAAFQVVNSRRLKSAARAFDMADASAVSAIAHDPHFRAVVDAIRTAEGAPHAKSKLVAAVLNLGDV